MIDENRAYGFCFQLVRTDGSAEKGGHPVDGGKFERTCTT